MTYRATVQDVELLDKHGLRFTDFCKVGFKRLQKDDRKELSDRIMLRMIIMVLGMLTFIFASFVSDPLIIVAEMSFGLFLVALGAFSIFMLWSREHFAR